MSNTVTQDVKALLEQEKFDEAKVAIQELVSRPISDKEQGEQVVKMLVAYMQYMTDLNEEYAETLDEAMKLLGDIDKQESEAMAELDREEKKASNS
ncbi:MAG: hypothetical protein WDZ82_02325 [Candidatus Paceibacterota bacterium]